MPNNKKETHEIDLIVLSESKDYFHSIFLEWFNDIKKKIQILLIICSLAMTLPLSSDFIMNLILNSIYSKAIFVVSQLLLGLSIVIMIYILTSSKLKYPEFDQMLDYKKNYSKEEIISSYVEHFVKFLNDNEKKIDPKKCLMKISEFLIMVSIPLLLLTITYGIIIS